MVLFEKNRTHYVPSVLITRILSIILWVIGMMDSLSVPLGKYFALCSRSDLLVGKFMKYLARFSHS